MSSSRLLALLVLLAVPLASAQAETLVVTAARMMVECGMTPMEAIQAATRNAAEALDRTADVGALAPGRYGDLIAVDGDPLQDVHALETVAVVIKGGQVVKGLTQ